MNGNDQVKLYLTDLENALADDKQGVYRDQVNVELKEQAAAIKQSIDAGLPPDEFPAAQGLQAGLEAAAAVVNQTWKEENGEVVQPAFPL